MPGAFAFKNAIFADGHRGQACQLPGCKSPNINIPGEFHAIQHAKRHHVPEVAVSKIQRRVALGKKGIECMASFMSRCKEQGKLNKATDDQREADVANARELGLDPPPVPMPPMPMVPLGWSDNDVPDITPQITLQQRTQGLFQELLDQIASLQSQISLGDEGYKIPPKAFACHGFKLKIPFPIFENYPFSLHSTESFIVWGLPDERGFLHSNNCDGWSASPACDSCMALGPHTGLRQLEERACNEDLHLSTVTDRWLTQNQIAKRLMQRRAVTLSLRLQLYDQNSQLTKYMHVSTDYERLVLQLSKDDLPRFPAVLNRLLKRNASPSAILKAVTAGIDGHSFKIPFGKRELQKSAALLILGGPRAVRLEQATNKGPGVRHVQSNDVFRRPRFYGCSGRQTYHSLTHNMNSFLENTPTPHAPSAWHLLFDNVNTDERLRYDTSGGEQLGGVKGVARESNFEGSLVICSHGDFEVIRNAVQNGDILLSKEMTVAVAVRNSNPPVIVPLYASGTAKIKGSDAAGDQARMLANILEQWESKAAPTHGKIISVSSDHDSTNGKTQSSMFRRDMAAGRRREICAKLILFDLEEGEGGVSASYDEQHNGKNHRAKMIRKGGFVIHLIEFTRESTIYIVTTVTGISSSVLEGYWPAPGVDDHQCVSSMVKGFNVLGTLYGKTIDASMNIPELQKPAMTQKLLELQPLAYISQRWVFLFTKGDASLADHVRNIASLAAAVFIVRRHCKKSLPSQLYTAIVTAAMRLIKDILACQCLCYTTYFLFLAATHILEQCFGMMRTFIASMRNFDCLQMEERMSNIVALRSIYEEHPTWRADPKRLSQTFDHWNTASWTGDVDPRNVNVVNMWAMGVQDASSELSKLPFYNSSDTDLRALLLRKPHTTLLNPQGKPPQHIGDEDVSDDETEVVKSETQFCM